jgi:3-deoxy-7-phosphoheptulonate synthase
MLLLLRDDLTPEDTHAVCASCEALGFRVRELEVGERGARLLEVEGDVGPEAAAKLRSVLEDHLAIAKVIDVHGARELVDAGPTRPETVVRVGDAVFGGGQAALIGGPCAVEDEAALLAVARGVRAAGGTLLRGGAMKPRSSPYAFQGLGDEALRMLASVGREVGLPIVSEVLAPGNVEAMLEACDMFQIGSRNMANTPLLVEVGKTNKPVLLKRGMSATAREFLLAAEYLLAGGNDQVVLCERGIRGFDSATRNVLDVGTVAHLKRATHLPVIVDPSHAAGRSELVRPLAKAGVAVGADGLIIEINETPMRAHSDARQAIDLAEFSAIADDMRRLLALDGRTLSTSTDPAPTQAH